MVYAIDTDAASDAALGALADAAERIGWPELTDAFRSELIRRDIARKVQVPEAPEA